MIPGAEWPDGIELPIGRVKLFDVEQLRRDVLPVEQLFRHMVRRNLESSLGTRYYLYHKGLFE